MCYTILKPRQTSTFVHENPSVCQNHDAPYHSLLQIFASTLLSQVSRQHNLSVSYVHKCDQNTRPVEEMTKVGAAVAAERCATVQSHLPIPYALNLEDDKGEILKLDDAQNLCRGCLLEYEQHGHSSPECILFADRVGVNAKTSPQRRNLASNQKRGSGDSCNDIMEALLPVIKKSIQMSAREDWYNDIMADLQKFILKESYAVIFISCHDEYLDGMCHPANMQESLKNLRRIIGREIPHFVKRIDIVVTRAVVKSIWNDVANVKEWVQRFYQRTKEVKLIVEESTAAQYFRMMKANYLLCTPGVSCLFPALATAHFATVVMGRSLEHLSWPDAFTLASSQVKVVTSNVYQSECKVLRGHSGKWIQDVVLAPALQYEITPRQELDPSTMYRWDEMVFKKCNFDPLTLDSLCAAVHGLGAKRLFFLGDSLSRQMIESLWRLVYKTNDPILQTLPEIANHPPSVYKRLRFNHLEHSINCPKINNFSFDLTYLRNDFITEMSNGGVEEKGPVVLPWIEKYTSYPGKTIMVVNTGPHIHSFDEFKHSFDEFTNAMDHFNRNEDIIFYRSTVPGHKQCQNFHEPFPQFSHFTHNIKVKDDTYKDYKWEIQAEFNDYAVKLIEDRNRRGGHHKRIEYLDVYLMGVLRPDGHLNPQPKKVDGDKPQDCLHWRLPGPIDWWNHLLVSNLQSMVDEMHET